MLKRLVFVILVSTIAFAQGGTLTPTGPASYTSSSPFNLNLQWAGTPSATAILYSWSAPTGVSITSMTLPPVLAASKLLVCSGTFPQTSGTCIVYSMNTTVIPPGPISTIAATPTGTTAITLTTLGIQAADANGLSITSTGAALTIPFINKCDLTGDGTVNGSDVTIIAQRIVAKPAIAPCDFDGNGSCDLFDLFVILKAALGGGCTAP